MSHMNRKSLFDRLESAEGISKLVDDIADEHMNNPAVQARFILLQDNPEKIERMKKQTRQFFGTGSGNLYLMKEKIGLLHIGVCTRMKQNTCMQLPI